MQPAATQDQDAAYLLEIKLETADGRLKGRLAVPKAPMRLAELAFNALPVVEQIVAQATRREQQVECRAISCRKGCGACCRQLVPLSPPEAWMLADLLDGQPASRRAGLELRFRAVVGRLDAAGLIEELLSTPPTDDAARSRGGRYFLMGEACPFLEDESCSIHPYRPSACREYLVTSPASLCANPTSSSVRRVNVSVRASEALARLTAELLGGEPQLIPLTLAPDWAREHADDGLRAWDGKFLITRLLDLMSGKQSASQGDQGGLLAGQTVDAAEPQDQVDGVNPDDRPVAD